LEAVIDTVLAYIGHPEQRLAVAACGAAGNFAAVSERHIAILIDKNIMAQILGYLQQFNRLHCESKEVLRLSALLAPLLDRLSVNSLIPPVLAYVSSAFVPDHRKWSTQAICRVLERTECLYCLFQAGVIDVLINAHQLFNGPQLPFLYEAFEKVIRHGFAAYLDRTDWYKVLYTLLNRYIQKFWDNERGFASVCTVIELMAESYGEQLFAVGIVGELIRVTGEERSNLRELAGACLAWFLLNAPPEFCDQISANGGLVAICEIVGNARVPMFKRMLEAILKMVKGDQRWVEVVQQSGITSLPEDLDPDNGCEGLIAALMNAVFPAVEK
jgi:hypothetical protein